MRDPNQLISVDQIAHCSVPLSSIKNPSEELPNITKLLSEEALALYNDRFATIIDLNSKLIFICRTVEAQVKSSAVKGLAAQINDMQKKGLIHGLYSDTMHFTITGILSNRYVPNGRGAIVQYAISNATQEEIANYKFQS